MRRRLAAGALVVAAALALGVDLSRPPAEQWSARALDGALAVYQATLSPLLARGGFACRFEPTCSHYARAAIEARGALRGSALASWRVLRCGPWTPAGTVDPPPPPA